MNYDRLDITNHSDDELSLIVFNDEQLYRLRHYYTFIDLIKGAFIFRDEQLEVLIDDLKEDDDE